MFARALAASLALALVPVVPLVPGDAVVQLPMPRAEKGSSEPFGPRGQQIFFAVLEGLYHDGVSNEVVDRIVVIDDQTKYPANFVWGCPACMPAYEAFRTYRARTAFNDKLGRDTFGPGLPPEVVAELEAVDLAVSQAALEELIRGWVSRRMDELRLTPEERETWKEEMAELRKKGMGFLQQYQRGGLGGSYAGMKTCPICEGANGACGKR
jgi:hypothetical protein